MVGENLAITLAEKKSTDERRKTQGSLSGMPGIVDPKASMGILSLFAMRAASSLPAETPPMTATTWSTSSKFFTASPTLSACDLVSRTINRISWPSMPPLALISSAATINPFNAASPLACASPLSGRKTPTSIILRGSGVGAGDAEGVSAAAV